MQKHCENPLYVLTWFRLKNIHPRLMLQCDYIKGVTIMWFHPIITRASTMGARGSMGIIILIFMTLVISHFGFHDNIFKVWM
jgi:hypothetical protein